MTKRILFSHHLEQFRDYLLEEEKSAATVEKYLRDAKDFFRFTDGREVSKELAVAYKRELQARKLAVRSINSMLASLNSLFGFLEWEGCKVKTLRLQRQSYSSADRELTKAEYLRLLEASRNQEQLHLILQTICATGIRVSELRYFTVEAVCCGEIVVQCKSKTRTILVPGKLKKLLLNYTKRRGIRSGYVFATRNGKPMDRSNIWAKMKRLCAAAGVNSAKVFPHNLRKLFARTFYGIEKDIAKLADILGHSSINTTRIYIMTTGAEHLRKIERLGLLI